jgi:hypothetical protein
MRSLLLADAEDRDDVSMVQPGRRARLPLEPSHLVGIGQHPGRQDLQGHPAAQVLLLGLVDHPHAAPADLAHEPELAQPAGRGAGDVLGAGGQRVGVAGGIAAEVFHHHQGGEDGADLLGQLGVLGGVVLGGGRLAASLALQELLGQGLDRVATAAGRRGRHRGPPGWNRPWGFARRRAVLGQDTGFPLKPGSAATISIIRFRARM